MFLRKLICCRLVGVFLTGAVQAALINLEPGVSYQQDFDTASSTGGGLANSGVWSDQVPFGWSFIEQGRWADGRYRISDGRSRIPGVYSFGTRGSIDRAFGIIPGRGHRSTAFIGAGFQNASATALTALAIEYVGEEWLVRCSLNRDRLDFQFSTDATSLTTGSWEDFNALDFVTLNLRDARMIDGNAPVDRETLRGTLDIPITPGGTFWIRWTMTSRFDNGEGLAVDDFRLLPVAALSPIPEPPMWSVGWGLLLVSSGVSLLRHLRLARG
jgi:hypothetical protein